MKKIAFAFAAVGMAGAATAFTTAPAFAETGTSETESVSINPSAYNVGSAVGYRELSERIERTADRVCGRPAAGQIREAIRIRQCRADAIAGAMRQLNRLAEAAADRPVATQ
jgi:UrcA family protein